jgi:hypothetical protein
LDFTDLNPFLVKPEDKVEKIMQKPVVQPTYNNLVKNTLPKPLDVLTVSLNGLKGQYSWVGTTYSSGLASMVIHAKAKNDIYMCFSETPSNKSYMYEIVIGGWNNTICEIRRYAQGTVLEKKKVNGMCDPEGAYYWALVENGTVKVGKGKKVGQDLIMSCVDHSPLNVKHIGLSCWDSRVEYSYRENFEPF